MKVCRRNVILFYITLMLFPGPVRAVAIHPTRALLATGGDDYKIKVWGKYRLIYKSTSN